MLAIICASKVAKAQTIAIPQGQTIRQTYKLNASNYTVDPININLLLSYDMALQEITLRITLERGNADHLWIPLRSYDDQMLNQAIKQNLNGKVSLNKPFKHQIVFGLTSAFECINCKPVATTTDGIKQELYGRKDTALFRFHVTEPHANVCISMRTCVPVQTTETASGKIRYTFLYLPDKCSLTLSVPTDPCEDSIIAILSDSITPCLDSLRAWYSSLGASCEIPEQLFRITDSIFTEAKSMQCPKAPTPMRVVVTPPEQEEVYPPKKPVNQIAMEIKKHAEALDKCINNIRNNKEVEKNRTEGGRICTAAQKYIDKLDEKSKEDTQVKSAIKRYESAARSFRKFK